MTSNRKNQYRIVTDHYAGYEVQIKRWWLPFWMQVGFANTHRCVEDAYIYANNHAEGNLKPKHVQEIVQVLGELPK